MRRYISLLIFQTFYFTFICAGNQIYAQNNIDSLIADKDVRSAIEEFQKIKVLDTIEVPSFLEIASYLSQVNQKDSAYYYLNKFLEIDTGFSNISQLYKFNLCFVIDDFRWDEWITKVIQNYEKDVQEIKNIDYCKALIGIRIKDNSFYDFVYFCESKYGKNSPTTVKVWEIKQQISRENIVVLESLINQYGWPTFSNVGQFASISFFIIQHAELEIQKKYLPIITDAYNENEAHFNWVAMLTDRILLLEGKPQRYGSQGIWNPILNKYVLYEVEDPEIVNDLRAKYKLGRPISEKALENMYMPEKQ